jgi:hypothetical protein
MISNQGTSALELESENHSDLVMVDELVIQLIRKQLLNPVIGRFPVSAV